MTLIVDVWPEAKTDIYDHGLYYLEHAGPQVFNRFHDALKQAFLLLADRPEMGERFRCRDANLGGLRRWRVSGFGEHVIYYRGNGAMLEIVRLLHGKQDLRGIFNQRDG